MKNREIKSVIYNCDNCEKECSLRKSHYDRYKRHFCCIKCYAEFRANKLPVQEQHAYKGVRKEGESKQVYHRNYCKNHPNNISHLKARRYAREKGADGKHTIQEWEALKLKFGNKCAMCKEDKKLTKDHIIPLSKGGSDYISNIQPLCKNCNSRKHNIIYEHAHLIK